VRKVFVWNLFTASIDEEGFKKETQIPATIVL
jgi:hypothetical protein